MPGEGATSAGPLRESRLFISRRRLGALPPRFFVDATDMAPNYVWPRAS
jgi:hypothetical protein